MKTTFKLCLIGATFAPMMAVAQTVDVTSVELDVFRDAITQVGCTIDTDELAAMVETQTAYDEATLDAIVDQLRVYQEIVDASTDGGITLVSGGCAS